MNPFALLGLLKKEKTIIQSLTSYELTNSQAFKSLTHPAIAFSLKDSEMMESVFDASDRPEGSDLII